MRFRIGLNDPHDAHQSNEVVEVEDWGGMVSHDDLNAAVLSLLNKHGGIAELLEPVAGDPQLKGCQRLVITVGPPPAGGE